MSIFSRISLLLLPLLCACSFYEYTPADDSADDPTSSTLPTEKYINLSIVVSSGNEGTTRANPNGGEEGDGREAGSERENEVTGITFMLYQDDAGINTTEDTKIAFIKYYPVTQVTETNEHSGNSFYDNIEAVYKTGEQPLGKDLDLEKKYHVIVVANMDLTRLFSTETTVKKVRDYIVTKIYQGTGIGINAKNFVMSLETDCTFDFTTATTERKENKLIYNFDNIRIERLAARVDFWMNKATYNETDYNTPGYVYDVDGSTDKFVLTAVMPFNIYDNDHAEAKEYLFKHVNAGTGTIQYLTGDYLEDETTTSYVIDPKTNDKGIPELGTTPAYYYNPLATLVTSDIANNKKLEGAGESKLYLSTKSLYDSKNAKETPWAPFDNITSDNFILCYTKENALRLDSPLYYYATGVAIEGDYYKRDETTPTHYVYYGYLRHQGEGYKDGKTYYTLRTAEDLQESREQEKAGDQNTKMNFGVVRNNIYRISIDGITKKGDESPEIKLQIKVKKWDTFTHSTIYM